MVEELNLIREILGDLTGVGIWGFIAFIGYSFLKFTIAICAFIYLVNKIIYALTCPVSKADYNKMQDRVDITRSERDKAIADGKMEVDKIKHLYKILKEASEYKEKSSE